MTNGGGVGGGGGGGGGVLVLDSLSFFFGFNVHIQRKLL